MEIHEALSEMKMLPKTVCDRIIKCEWTDVGGY